MTKILAAQQWTSNAELLADVATLYLDPDDVVLDPTFGNGVWWKRYMPPNLVRMERADGADFTAIPFADESVDAVAYDPPYVCPGGRSTSTIKSFNDRYGLSTVPATPALLQDLIDAGTTECARVLRPSRRVDGRERGGLLLVKCADYIWSGKLWIGSHLTLSHALSLGLEPVDRFVYVGHAGAQPGGRTRKCPSCRGTGHWPATRDEVAHGAPPPPAPFNVCGQCEGSGRQESGQQHAVGNVSILHVLRKKRGLR